MINKSRNQNKFLIAIFVLILSFSCSKKHSDDEKSIKQNIHTNLNLWHQAAANANFKDYFNLMTKDGVFLGTDATENWQNQAFKTFSKPYFDKGKAWSFTPVERNIYLSKDRTIAWFDELLDTQMKLCRGSGVMKLEDNTWKIQHYVLSIAIPNKNVKEVVALKRDFDSLLTNQLKTKTFFLKNN